MADENPVLLDESDVTYHNQGIVLKEAVVELKPHVNVSVPEITDADFQSAAKRKEKLMAPPSEINALMANIDEMLGRGEEIPDSLIQELESQINTAGDFDVEELYQRFSNASNFYGISSLLNDVHRRAQLLHGFSNDADLAEFTKKGAQFIPPESDADLAEFTEEGKQIIPPESDANLAEFTEEDVQLIPPASDDDLMEYMRGDDHTNYGNSPTAPQEISDIAAGNTMRDTNDEQREKATSSSEFPKSEPVESESPAEKAVRDAKVGERAKTASLNSSESNANHDRTLTKKPVATDRPSEDYAQTKDKEVVPVMSPVANVQQQELQVHSKPLLGSLTNTFSSMMGWRNKNKSAETHLSSEEFSKNIISNKIKDFEKLCDKQLSSLENISELAKLSAETLSDKGTDIIKSKVSGFMKMTGAIGKEYEKLIKSTSQDDEQSKQLKVIAKKHAENMKMSKEDLIKSLGDNAPSSLMKLLSGVMESVKKITNKIFKIKPGVEKHENVSSEPQPN